MKSKTGKRIFLALGCILLLLLAFGTWYVNDYYRADTDAIAAFSPRSPELPVMVLVTVEPAQLSLMPSLASSAVMVCIHHVRFTSENRLL